ncbi:MAG: FHA domain-containing protein [Microbacterium sp.]|jgi:Na+-transporting methylmalonyl-CoA/oxaloacetate decarboxylase gamma subunit|uniref:FHA domain-containing protein n=1 Tax=Microbacterium sp. TaxID=51671 RepID=UPI0025D67A28|nr:FHA domain-containing protein [Microbacterium sp.]MBQ9915601.1 FHA domain-containing protein [Microbacterium sp.]
MTSTHDPLRLADVDPLVFTERARGGQIVGAVALDVVMPVALLAAGIIVIVAGQPALGWVFVLAALALLAVAVWLLGRTGRTVGVATVDARIVRRTTGAAAGAGALWALASGKLAMFDVRRGRDPFAPAIAAFQFPEAVAPAPSRARRGMVPTLLLDSGERLTLDTALVLGRDPSAPADAPAEVYRWADMSRTLSKSHVRLEWDGRQMWVTDLASTNGTFVRGAGASTPLLPHQRTPVPTDVVLEIGDRTLTVRDAA